MEFEPFKISGGNGEPFVISKLRAFVVSDNGEANPEEEAVRLSGFCFATAAATPGDAQSATLDATYLFNPHGKPVLLHHELAWRTKPSQ